MEVSETGSEAVSCPLQKSYLPFVTDDGRLTTKALEWVGNILLNEALVEEGLAWVSLRYCKSPECAGWARAQQEVRLSKSGLWKQIDMIPPWEFRRLKR